MDKISFNTKFLMKLHYKNLKNYFEETSIPLSESLVTNSVQWIGHASVMINLYDNIFITDPVIGSIGQFKRKIKPSMNLVNSNINYILLSHGHMDHIDFYSLIKMNKNVIVLCPKSYVKSIKVVGFKNVIGISEGEIHQSGDITIKCIAANHDGRRYYLGKDHSSNAYLISCKDKSVFFAGDTAFTENFKEIESDVALMPVGCYWPEGFDKMHCTPLESYKMYKMMKSKKMLPIHYNTFILSLEDDLDTVNILKSIKDSTVDIVNIGKTSLI
ncbi:MBL fold metallo-hydrolase [Clostridium algidicarnis]|uniref:MBL fold metallo-hydrolase n=2 Tax=Clostridium algidicarnis TaxID=37659 RepID=UPI001C0E739A|nr:MBL fold metallo-hydrolase [Clostridium algidicarnis]MBU3210286.1 MBL fold metallo-hydrolase [Clostridium algidicarnis]MBU3228643.1 MBL fold metallo-hydrolase [Clostridium algidicarnis]MBU3251311.1 MBL fold metallo-hydrolase [Clostridium algidicarnis]